MARLNVRVQPGARRDRVVGQLADGAFKLAVTAPPLDGRANEAVTKFLARTLGIKSRGVRIVKGSTSRSKWIEVDELSDDECVRRLLKAATDGKQE